MSEQQKVLDVIEAEINSLPDEAQNRIRRVIAYLMGLVASDRAAVTIAIAYVGAWALVQQEKEERQ
jgi:hypothetical protein